jgi:hypothetical protein
MPIKLDAPAGKSNHVAVNSQSAYILGQKGGSPAFAPDRGQPRGFLNGKGTPAAPIPRKSQSQLPMILSLC